MTTPSTTACWPAEGKGDLTPEEYTQISCEVAVHRGRETLASMLARDPEFREMLVRELRAR